MRRISLPLIWVLVVAAGLACLTQSSGAEWKVTEEVKDGVKWIHNPATPKDGVREIKLRELWRKGGDPEDEEAEIFGVIVAIFQDHDGNICMVDMQLSEIRVYSPEGEFLRSMGRAGEGPGEFQQAGAGCLLPDGGYGVVQTWPGKIIKFNTDGTPAGTLVPKVEGAGPGAGFLVTYGAGAAGDNLVIACMNQVVDQTKGVMDRDNILGVFDLEGNMIARLIGYQDQMDFAQGIQINEVDSGRFRDRWTATTDGTIYAVLPFFGYEIRAFDPQGKEQMVITREYETIKRTDEEIQGLEEIYAGFTRQVPNAVLNIEKSHKDVESLRLGPGGTLWAQSSEGRWRLPEGAIATYDVFDKEGHFVEQVTLLGDADPTEDGVWVLDDKVVVVTNFISSVMSLAGGGGGGGEDEDEDEDVEDEGAEIICYAM